MQPNQRQLREEGGKPCAGEELEGGGCFRQSVSELSVCSFSPCGTLKAGENCEKLNSADQMERAVTQRER